MKLALGLYGIYFLLVAVKGNATALFNKLQGDLPQFLPWLIVAAVLGGLYSYTPTRKVAGGFAFLVVVSFVLKNFNNIKAQFSSIYSGAVSGSGTTTTTASTTAQTTNTVAPLPPLQAGTMGGL